MKWIKRSVTGLLVLVFLLLLVAVAVVITFDPNDYKPRIAALIEQHTGRRCALMVTLSLACSHT